VEVPEQFQNAESQPSASSNQSVQYSYESTSQMAPQFYPPVGNYIYTPFNPTQLPIPSNPLSLVTVAITPPQIIRTPQSVTAGVPLTSHPTPGLYGQTLGTTPAALSQAPQTPSFNDANNDASSWTEHEGDDGRKYWYNRVTQVRPLKSNSCSFLNLNSDEHLRQAGMLEMSGRALNSSLPMERILSRW
jgi:uncharacterized membrane protein